MGPTEYPSTIKDTTQIGSLFSLMLHAPTKAFCFISDVGQVSAETWEKLGVLMTALERTIVSILDSNSAQLDKSYKRFLQDDFLRSFITRFVISHVLFTLHSAFKEHKVS